MLSKMVLNKFTGKGLNLISYFSEFLHHNFLIACGFCGVFKILMK